MFTNVNRRWTKESLIVEARKYTGKSEFVKGHRIAYFTMINRFPGLIDELFTNKTKRWNLKSALDIIVTCRTISEFQIKHNSAYCWVRRNSPEMIYIFLAESFSRNLRDVVYIWCADEDEGLYKLGITSSTVSQNRITRVKNDGQFSKANIVTMVNVGEYRLSRKLENMLKEIGEKVKFERKFDGYTEFRKWKPHELKNAVTMLHIFAKEIII
jgi:hypothetical protein